MAPRKATATEPGRTTWGAVDWSHAPVAARDYAGPCFHCGRPAILKHPVKLAPCHKVCDDAHQARQQ